MAAKDVASMFQYWKEFNLTQLQVNTVTIQYDIRSYLIIAVTLVHFVGCSATFEALISSDEKSTNLSEIDPNGYICSICCR